MELEITDTNTGEVMRKEEEVFLGDFPLMTKPALLSTGDNVIVSQIVRSPGAYFSTGYEEKTGKTSYSCELIPSRGAWLEFMTELKKSSTGRQLSVSIDRKRKILSSVLFKAIGMSVDLMPSEDPLDTSQMESYLRAMGREWSEDLAIDDENHEYGPVSAVIYRVLRKI